MNRFREDEEEIGPEPELKVKAEKIKTEEDKRFSETFIGKFFTEGVISKEAATDALPFLCFLAFLGMIYIANSHFAVNNVRRIDKLNKEVKELRWEYKSLKADLMFKSKLTEVAKKVDTLGIKELIEPPKKIIVKSDEY
ncbi:FtsL-like putative cell division protein [Pedobacter rhodius]|uniref:FtsL-like putative cell division protein n=1 Tax=Pedobacter rhodius TaxID=3004098 RepID=A0ABT4KSE1_9SPHI|nr:FtsL-like putative cell division protein [Pedobacter sp. SJ11]MCZ4221838.1 FtsL-like putative cell division protein [Pedobacter sp. SJ11]